MLFAVLLVTLLAGSEWAHTAPDTGGMRPKPASFRNSIGAGLFGAMPARVGSHPARLAAKPSRQSAAGGDPVASAVRLHERSGRPADEIRLTFTAQPAFAINLRAPPRLR
jgi:hypothetical protein